MTRTTMAGGAVASAFVLLALVAGHRAFERCADLVATDSPAIAPPTISAAPESHPAPGSFQGFLYGQIATVDGATYEGRLRWGGDEEAFWGDFFNGAKLDNPWLAHISPERLQPESRPIEIFGFRIGARKRELDLGRPFVARFGEIARIEARGDEVRVTLKSGSAFDLDRFDASDFDDGVRVWDDRRGVVDLDSLRIRTIELLPTPPLAGLAGRLHGTVRTLQRDFTGFVGWHRDACVRSDELHGRTDDGKLDLRFDTVRSIARRARDRSLVTLLDGREIEISDSEDAGDGHRGVQVDDPRFGRVLVSWDAFERVDFDRPGEREPGGSGAAYGDFPPGRPLTGSVVTCDGRHFAGRLVFDLDESETTDTLDAQDRGVQYTLPFGQIASIVPPGRDERGARHARVTLQNGEELALERAGDLGDRNGGLLIFVDGGERAAYVPWPDVERIELDRPAATDPALGAR